MPRAYTTVLRKLLEMRIDVRLKEEFNISRQKAQELISQQAVFVNDRLVKKPSMEVLPEDKVRIEENDVLKYVSRGGLKLEKGLEAFNISVKDCICVDIGASTGGFTHVLLKNNAKKVYAVDVGTDQLAESLRRDLRVVSLENTNILDFADDFYECVDFVCIDVSFVSVTKILHCIKKLLKDGAFCVMLVKPQFECGREHNKNGIVKDKKVHKNVLTRVIGAAFEAGLEPLDLIQSPIKGGDGNVEYLLKLQNCENPLVDPQLKAVVERVVKG